VVNSAKATVGLVMEDFDRRSRDPPLQKVPVTQVLRAPPAHEVGAGLPLIRSNGMDVMTPTGRSHLNKEDHEKWNERMAQIYVPDAFISKSGFPIRWVERQRMAAVKIFSM